MTLRYRQLNFSWIPGLKSNPVSKWCSSSTAIHWNLEAPEIPYLNKRSSGQGQRSELPSASLLKLPIQWLRENTQGLIPPLGWQRRFVQTMGLQKTLKSLYIGILFFQKTWTKLEVLPSTQSLFQSYQLLANGLIASD